MPWVHRGAPSASATFYIPYEKHGANIGAMLFALAVLALLAGAVGAGPLAGKVVTP